MMFSALMLRWCFQLLMWTHTLPSPPVCIDVACGVARGSDTVDDLLVVSSHDSPPEIHCFQFHSNTGLSTAPQACGPPWRISSPLWAVSCLVEFLIIDVVLCSFSSGFSFVCFRLSSSSSSSSSIYTHSWSIMLETVVFFDSQQLYTVSQKKHGVELFAITSSTATFFNSCVSRS